MWNVLIFFHFGPYWLVFRITAIEVIAAKLALNVVVIGKEFL